MEVFAGARPCGPPHRGRASPKPRDRGRRRAAPSACRRAGRRPAPRSARAGGTAERVPARALLVEEQLDPSVGGRLERVLPTRDTARAPGRPPGASARRPRSHARRATAPATALPSSCRSWPSPRAASTAAQPTTASTTSVCSSVEENSGTHLLRADDHDSRSVEPPERVLELLGDRLVVLVGDVLDMALEAGLRPAPLVVAARRILRPVGDLGHLAAVSQGEHAPLLPVDDGHERTVAAPEERHERCEQEVVRDVDPIRNRGRQRRARSRRCRALPRRRRARGRRRARAPRRGSAPTGRSRPSALAPHLMGEVAARRTVRLRRLVEQGARRASPCRRPSASHWDADRDRG